MALLNESMNSPQGNINAVLYRLANLSASPLHDITSGGNVVPCQTNPPTTGCPTSGSGAGSMGYSAGPGYDMATGLGSIDANALVSAWSSVALPPDFDISVAPANITLNRGNSGTAQIMVNHVGGLTGVPALSCNVPAIFQGVTCSIASAGANTFTLTLTSSISAAELFPAANTRPGAQPFAVRMFSYEGDSRTYPLAAWLRLRQHRDSSGARAGPQAAGQSSRLCVGVACLRRRSLAAPGQRPGGSQNSRKWRFS